MTLTPPPSCPPPQGPPPPQQGGRPDGSTSSSGAASVTTNTDDKITDEKLNKLINQFQNGEISAEEFISQIEQYGISVTRETGTNLTKISFEYNSVSYVLQTNTGSVKGCSDNWEQNSFNKTVTAFENGEISADELMQKLTSNNIEAVTCNDGNTTVVTFEYNGTEYSLSCCNSKKSTGNASTPQVAMYPTVLTAPDGNTVSKTAGSTSTSSSSGPGAPPPQAAPLQKSYLQSTYGFSDDVLEYYFDDVNDLGVSYTLKDGIVYSGKSITTVEELAKALDASDHTYGLEISDDGTIAFKDSETAENDSFLQALLNGTDFDSEEDTAIFYYMVMQVLPGNTTLDMADGFDNAKNLIKTLSEKLNMSESEVLQISSLETILAVSLLADDADKFNSQIGDFLSSIDLNTEDIELNDELSAYMSENSDLEPEFEVLSETFNTIDEAMQDNEIVETILQNEDWVNSFEEQIVAALKESDELLSLASFKDSAEPVINAMASQTSEIIDGKPLSDYAKEALIEDLFKAMISAFNEMLNENDNTENTSTNAKLLTMSWKDALADYTEASAGTATRAADDDASDKEKQKEARAENFLIKQIRKIFKIEATPLEKKLVKGCYIGYYALCIAKSINDGESTKALGYAAELAYSLNPMSFYDKNLKILNAFGVISDEDLEKYSFDEQFAKTMLECTGLSKGLQVLIERNRPNNASTEGTTKDYTYPSKAQISYLEEMSGSSKNIKSILDGYYKNGYIDMNVVNSLGESDKTIFDNAMAGGTLPSITLYCENGEYVWKTADGDTYSSIEEYTLSNNASGQVFNIRYDSSTVSKDEYNKQVDDYNNMPDLWNGQIVSATGGKDVVCSGSKNKSSNASLTQEEYDYYVNNAGDNLNNIAHYEAYKAGLESGQTPQAALSAANKAVENNNIPTINISDYMNSSGNIDTQKLIYDWVNKYGGTSFTLTGEDARQWFASYTGQSYTAGSSGSSDYYYPEGGYDSYGNYNPDLGYTGSDGLYHPNGDSTVGIDPLTGVCVYGGGFGGGDYSNNGMPGFGALLNTGGNGPELPGGYNDKKKKHGNTQGPPPQASK